MAREIPDAVCLDCGSRAQTVVHVSDRASDADPDGGSRQRDGIGAARASDQDDGAVGQAAGDRTFDAVRQISHTPTV